MSTSNQIDDTSGVAPVAGDTVAVDRPHRKLRGTLGVWGSFLVVGGVAARRHRRSGALGIAGGNGVGFPPSSVVSTVIILLFGGRIHRADAVRRMPARSTPTSARAWAG